jgi:ligand-binding sensor domain-containing protein
MPRTWPPMRNHESLMFQACLLLMTSCTGKAAPSMSAEDPFDTSQAQQPGEPEPDPAPPIAEYVVAAFEDSEGIVWFGTMNKGVARHDPTAALSPGSGQALTYLTEKDGLCGDTIASVAQDKEGRLWFAGHTGVCRYDGKTFTRFFDVEGRVRTDRKGNIWVSTNNAVYRYDGSSFIEFEVPLVKVEGQPYSIINGRVFFVMEDSQGNLWFSTDGYGAFRYDGTSFTQFTKKDGLCSNTVWNILEDRQGRIWFTCVQAYQPTTTGDGGVCRYDGKTFTNFPEVAGLTANDIYTIYEDRSDNIWIGATGLGAYRYDEKDFTLFKDTDRPDLITNFSLQAILEDRNGTLWGGFSGGLFRFNGESFVHVGQDGPWK